MKKNSISREEAEKNEGLEQIHNDVPDNRQQAVQQVATTTDAERVSAPKTGFTVGRSGGKGDVLKQQQISDVITGSSPSAGMGTNFAGRHVSGTGGGILGANNSTPEAGKSRSDSRPGKKLDRAATKLNYTPCEAVIVDVQESKPLADAADKDQGYNGTYRNEAARSQKIAGAVPGDLMYQRSVDLITKDKLYFVEGQQVFQNASDRTDLNPTTTIDPTETVVTRQKKEVTYHSGNYLHRGMHVGLKADGDAEYVYFDVDDITPDAVSAEDANMASAHRLIKSNTAELDRMVMDAKAGDEKADLWTPLARAIDEPTRASYLMSSIEADTGAYAYLAYAKASVNMAYQLNKGAKDGLDILGPALEQCAGWRSSPKSSLDYRTKFPGGMSRPDVSALSVFDRSCYRAGDPTLMIEAYDSIAKYNNKADLLLQPRGWRMHLQTADNNINPLKVPKQFAALYAASETFSTIDHDYDPVLPVCMTDKANIVTVHSLNELGGFIKNVPAHYDMDATWSAYDPTKTHTDIDKSVLSVNAIKALQALGYTHVHMFAKAYTTGDYVNQAPVLTVTTVSGEKEYLYQYAHNDNDGRRRVEIQIILGDEDAIDAPTGYSYVQLSGDNAILPLSDMGELIIACPAVQSVTANVVTAGSIAEDVTPITYAKGCRPYAYRYSDLRNVYIVEVKHPLVEGILQYLKDSIGSKIYSLIAQEDFYIPFVFSAQYMTLAQLVICAAMPWITRVRQNSLKDVIYYEDNVKAYPYSKLDSIKNVPFKNYVNFTFKDYDTPLETKVMDPARAINWTMPEFFWKVGTRKYVSPWYTSECDLNVDGTVDDDAATMSMPSIRNGHKLGQLDSLYGMDEKDIRLSLDRMTKTFFRSTKITHFGAYKYGRTTDGQIFICLDDDQIITVHDLLSCPRELGLSMDCPLGVLTPDLADIGGGDAFSIPLKSMTDDGTATSYRIRIWTNTNSLETPSILAATGVNISRAANYTQKWFELQANNATSSTSIAGLVFGMSDEGNAQYIPFAELGSGAQDSTNGVAIVSLQRSLNTRLQFLPFVISPFDAVATGESIRDLYDVAYAFNLAGFRASDYRESVYNREKEVINQGLLFVEDPWVKGSPILREGSASTGIALPIGYKA